MSGSELRIDDAETAESDAAHPEGDVTWAEQEPDIGDLLGFDFSDENAVDRSGLRALINSALISHRRLPMLDVIFDRTARRMTTSLRQMTDENVEVTLDDVTSTRFGDFQASLPQPTVIGVAYSAKLDNYCLVAADAHLVSSIVDLLLGGRRKAGVMSIEDRRFTAIELSLAERMLSLLVSDLDDAFQPVESAEFTLDRLETTPRFAAIAQDASVCALAKFRVRIDELGGRASVIIPHATLEPLRGPLLREFIGEAHNADAAWRENLLMQIKPVAISIDAIIAEKTLSLGEVSALRKGDTLIFTGAADGEIDLRAGDASIGAGEMGRSGDCVAVKLSSTVMKETADDLGNPAETKAHEQEPPSLDNLGGGDTP